MSIIDKILTKRGVTKEQLQPKNPDIHFKELDDLVKYVIPHYFLQHEAHKTLISYDVDVDGLMSGKILEDLLKRYGVQKIDRIMNKMKQHGITKEVVQKCIEEGYTWLFVVDAGSNDYEAMQQLSKAGVTVVVLDHHKYEEKPLPPNVFIVNISKYPDIPQLSGCGVVYQFIKQIGKAFKMNVQMYEKYVGISTISDMMDMSVPENRYYVEQLYSERKTEDNYFFRQFKFYGSNRSFFAWVVIPYLNALIRIGNEKQAMYIVNHMHDRAEMNRIGKNYMRVKIRQQELISEIREASKENITEHTVIYLRTTKAEGRTINGLLANQLMKQHKRSALVLYYNVDKKKWEGSFRGLQYTNELLRANGFTCMGHDKACGIEVSHADLKKFAKTKLENVKYTGVDVDLRVKSGELTREEWEAIASFNEMTGEGLPPIAIELQYKEYGAEYIEKTLEGKAYKKYIQIDSQEVIEFIGESSIQGERMKVIPTLNAQTYQLVREE